MPSSLMESMFLGVCFFFIDTVSLGINLERSFGIDLREECVGQKFFDSQILPDLG